MEAVLIRIRVLRGSRAGVVAAFERGPIRIGRQADSDLRFEPESDRLVSGRHAIVFQDGDHWHVRDNGSTNGTFVNGEPLTGDAVLRAGDHIELGIGGPVIEVLFGDDAPADSTTKVVRAHYVRENRRLKLIAGAAAMALMLAVVTLVVVGSDSRRERAAWERERAVLLARMDTVLAQSDDAIASLRGELDGLVQALQQSQASVRNTRGALERLPSQSGAEAEELRRELRSATEALSRQQLAASLDFRAIERANRPAVAMIHVEAEDGTVSTASAFAVRAGGMLVTAAHVLRGANGQRAPRRIGVQFSDSRQVFPARLAAYATDADLAVITVDNVLGEVPVIAGFNAKLDTLPAGAPVAIIGFPLDGDVQLDNTESRGTARPLMTAAILTRTSARTIELQGYGAAGASGSPVFDAAGNVVGVLSGGTTSEGRRLLVAVPSAVALALIARID